MNVWPMKASLSRARETACFESTRTWVCFPRAHLRKKVGHYGTILTLRRQRLEPLGSLASQPNQISKYRAHEKPVFKKHKVHRILKKKKKKMPEANIWPHAGRHTCMCTHTHPHTYQKYMPELTDTKSNSDTGLLVWCSVPHFPSSQVKPHRQITGQGRQLRQLGASQLWKEMKAVRWTQKRTGSH